MQQIGISFLKLFVMNDKISEAEIMKNNGYRKLFSIDRFARKYYCQHARLNQLRSDKKQAKRAVRRKMKSEIQ